MSTCNGTWNLVDFFALTVLYILLVIVLLIGLIFLFEIVIRPTTQKSFRVLFYCFNISSSIQIASYIASYYACDTHFLYAIGLTSYATNCAILLAVLISRLRSAFKDTVYQLPPTELFLFIISYIPMAILIIISMILMLSNILSRMFIVFYLYLSALLIYTGLSMVTSLIFINNLLGLSNKCKACASLHDLSNIDQLKEMQHKLHIASRYISLLLLALFSTAILMITSAIVTVFRERIAHLLICINTTLNIILLYLQCPFADNYYINCCCCINMFWNTFLMDEKKENIVSDEENPLQYNDEGSNDEGSNDTNNKTKSNDTLNRVALGYNANMDIIVSDANRAYQMLKRSGFQKRYTKRALSIYEKHYEKGYDLKIIEEIIYRLTIKDKVKEQQKMRNLYESRQDIEGILLSLNVAPNYIDAAITLFEIMAEILEIEKHHKHIYDLEIITEMTMRLRAKDIEDMKKASNGEIRNKKHIINESKEKDNNALTVNEWEKVLSYSDKVANSVDIDNGEDDLYPQTVGDPHDILQGYWKMYSKMSSRDES